MNFGKRNKKILRKIGMYSPNMKVKSINDNTLEFVLKRKTYVKFALKIDNLGNLEGKIVTTQLLKDNEEKLLQSSVPYLQERERKILEKFSEHETDDCSLLDTLLEYDHYEEDWSIFRGYGVEHCIIQDVDVLAIRQEENTGFITLNEYERNNGTEAHSFKLQLLSEGFGIEIGKQKNSVYEKFLQNQWYNGPYVPSFYEKRYPIEFAIRRDKYEMPPFCIWVNTTLPARESDEPRKERCGNCDACYYGDGCGYDPPSREDERVVSTMTETELHSELMEVIVQLSEELNLLGLPGDLQREILNLLSVSDLNNVIRGFMSQCEPLENLFLGSTATYFIDEYPWSTNVGDFIKYSIYKKI